MKILSLELPDTRVGIVSKQDQLGRERVCVRGAGWRDSLPSDLGHELIRVVIKVGVSTCGATTRGNGNMTTSRKAELFKSERLETMTAKIGRQVKEHFGVLPKFFRLSPEPVKLNFGGRWLQTFPAYGAVIKCNGCGWKK